MQRSIKFRYIFEDKKGTKHTLTLGIEDIETFSDIPRNLREGWKLLARDEYTGLKDKKVTEIYEDDQVIQVLLGEHDANIPDDIFEGVVVWDTNGWAIKGHDGRIETSLMPCDKYTQVNIIGNVHEGI